MSLLRHAQHLQGDSAEATITPAQLAQLQRLGVSPEVMAGLSAAEVREEIGRLLAEEAAQRAASKSGGSAPEDADPQMLALARYFVERAAHYDVELAAGLSYIYRELLRRIEATHTRERKLQDVDYWAAMLLVMIDEFWRNDVSPATERWAISEFTEKRYFLDSLNWARDQLFPPQAAKSSGSGHVERRVIPKKRPSWLGPEIEMPEGWYDE